MMTEPIGEPLKLPKHECGLMLSHNEYKNYYDTIEEAVLEMDEHADWVDGERGNSLETGEIWELHWYPRTPVAFHCLAASTLEAVLKAALESP